MSQPHAPSDRSGPSEPRPEAASSDAGFEKTRWSKGLIGFYLSCAGVAIGATIGSAGYIWFGSVPALVVGIGLTLVCCVTCFLALRAARR